MPKKEFTYRGHTIEELQGMSKPTTGTQHRTEDTPRKHQKSKKKPKRRTNSSHQNPCPQHDSPPRNGRHHPPNPQRKRVHVSGDTARNDWILPGRVRHHQQTRETWISRYRRVKVIYVCAPEIERNKGRNIPNSLFLLKIERWVA